MLLLYARMPPTHPATTNSQASTPDVPIIPIVDMPQEEIELSRPEPAAAPTPASNATSQPPSTYGALKSRHAAMICQYPDSLEENPVTARYSDRRRDWVRSDDCSGKCIVEVSNALSVFILVDELLLTVQIWGKSSRRSCMPCCSSLAACSHRHFVYCRRSNGLPGAVRTGRSRFLVASRYHSGGSCVPVLRSGAGVYLGMDVGDL